MKTCETCDVSRWLVAAIEYAALCNVRLEAPVRIVSPCQCRNMRDDERRRLEFMEKHQET